MIYQKDNTALELLEENYKEFGKYVNTHRGCWNIDGLKSVQRRVLMSVKECDRGGEIGSTEVISHCLNNFHPHGDASIFDTLVRLVQKKFIISSGNFGNIDTFENSDAANYRYTSILNHKEFTNGVFKFVDRVEKIENEYGRIEPLFLPVPIPLSLITSASAIGFGLHCSCPMFSAKSLFEALHKDDPLLLKAPNGLFLLSGDVEDMWNKGEGFLQYGYKCYKQYSDLEGKDVSIIEGPGRYFSTSVNQLFEKMEEEGSVIVRDESTKMTRVIISRVKNIKRITDEEVHKLAQQSSVSNMFFRIYVNHENATRRMSMKNWMQILWNKYDSIVNEYKVQKIADINHKIYVLNLIPKVSPLIRKDISSEDIASKFNVDVSIIKEIENKSLRILRNTEFDKEIDLLNKDIIATGKLSSKILAKDVVDVLEKSQNV